MPRDFASNRGTGRVSVKFGGGGNSGAIHSVAFIFLLCSALRPKLLLSSGSVVACDVLLCVDDSFVFLVVVDMLGAGGGRTRLRSDPTCQALLATSKNSMKACLRSAGSSEVGTWLSAFRQSV